ncbi:MAG: hypothetical protein HY910_09510 [Desulfarculus sp.]|nr:hypothetical protein [Desulfarculus sp.]
MRRGLTSLLLSFLLLLSALGGGAPVAGPLPAPPEAPRSCPCMPDSPCQCPADSSCHMSQDLPAPAAPMAVNTLDWPQDPGLSFGGWVACHQGPAQQVASRPAPPAPPPEPLYLQKASLLI